MRRIILALGLLVSIAAHADYVPPPGATAILNANWRHVTQDGRDVPGCGTMEMPCLTIPYMLSALTDASASNPYVIFLGPGHFTGGASQELNANVSIVGAGAGTTFLAPSSGSLTIHLTTSNTTNAGIQLRSMSIPSSVSVFRDAGTPSVFNEFHFHEVYVAGSFTATGSGDIRPDGEGGATNQDILYFWNSEIAGTFTSNGMNARFQNSVGANVAFSDTGSDASGQQLVNFVSNSRVNFVTISGSVAMRVFGSRASRYVLNGTSCTMTSDSSSFPTTQTLNSGATLAQITRSNRAYATGYVPTTSALWTSTPTTVQEALDQLTSLSASATTRGYLTAADWNTFNNKEPAITAGTTAQYLRGDKSLSTFATDAKAAAVSDTAYNSGTWDAVTDVAPSKNAVRDQTETMLTSIAGKEPAITAGTTAQYLRGDKSLSTFATDAKSAAVSDTAYDATSWNGVTDVAPSKNAVRDQVETLVTLSTAQTVSSKQLAESNQFFDGTDTTKKLQFELGSMKSGDTVKLEMPADLNAIAGNVTVQFPSIPSGFSTVALISNASPTISSPYFNDYFGMEDMALDFAWDTIVALNPTSFKFNVMGYGGALFLQKNHGEMLDITASSRVEIDFGSTPLTEKSFTITDANVVATDVDLGTPHRIDASIARATSTGKTYVDETDMDSFYVSCSPGAGSLTCLVRGLTGQLRGTFNLDYKYQGVNFAR